jgi:hypothetical protein
MRTYHQEAVRNADKRTGRTQKSSKKSSKKRKTGKPRRRKRSKYDGSDSEEVPDASQSESVEELPKRRKQKRNAYDDADNCLEARVQKLEHTVKQLNALASPPPKKLQALHCHGSDEESDAGMEVPKFIKGDKLVITQEPAYEERGSVLHVDSDSWRKLKDQDGDALLEGWIEVRKFTLCRGWGNLEFPEDQILLNPNKAGQV